MPHTVRVESHPLLEVGAFVTRVARALGEIEAPDFITRFANPSATPWRITSDVEKAALRELLRAGGFKPAGRSKPASEYLAAAAADGRFPRINALVDACNVVSLHAGLPISLVDLDKLEGALAIRIATPGTSYPFNPTGQVIDASGLVCLHDGIGPTGTPVKDAQRTKTHDGTRATLSIVWGTRALAGRTAEATQWYRQLVQQIEGATIEDVTLVRDHDPSPPT